MLYRIDGDGRNMTPLSGNALSESTPSVVNDGRILYTRWEYVYKGVIAVQSLWAMWPDGSHSAEVFGNEELYPPVLIHGRAVPGCNDLFVATCTMHHPFAVGPILLIEDAGCVKTRALFWIWRCRIVLLVGIDKYDDPVAYGLWLVDVFGNRVLVYRDPHISCWQPVPLRPRAVPPSLPPAGPVDMSASKGTLRIATSNPRAEMRKGRDKVSTSEAEATMLMTDVYRGLQGIPRGEIKYLRMLEQVPRPWTAKRFWPDDITSGQNAAVSLGSHIFVTILHGVVPVAEDGSAHFTVPAGRNLFFQALDEQFMEIERMRTFVNLRPGEVRSCIGCHQSRNEAPPIAAPLAMTRPADRPQPQPGDLTVPRPLYYPADVQPILDQHCVRCHGGPDARE